MEVFSKIILSISSFFSTVFIDISLIFVQLGLENFRKTVRDPPPFITFAGVLWKKEEVDTHEISKDDHTRIL